MNEFNKHFDEVRDLLRFGDYGVAAKRLIDFTLDTEDIAFYQKTNLLLNWLDGTPPARGNQIEVVRTARGTT